jgi:hypothetical protein
MDPVDIIISPEFLQMEKIQALLSMLGIPYILAPFEAESQCAWLE